MLKTTKAFDARRPGDIYPSRIDAGEEVDGRLAEIAEQLGALESADSKPARKTKAVKAAPENKAQE